MPELSPEEARTAVQVQVVLPCLNEAEALPALLVNIPEPYGVLLVDNGSSDDSARIATDLGATVIDCQQRGYGAACHAGLLAATAPIVVVMDADGSLDPGQLPRVVDPVRTGAADLTIGRRRVVGRRSWPWWLRVANHELARQLRVRTGCGITDLGPVRAARREALLALPLSDRRSGYPAETVVAAADAGWRITQVEVDYRQRIGRSKVTGTLIGAWRAVRDMRSVIAR